MKKLLFLLPLSVFVLLVGFFAAGLQYDPSRVPSPLIGKSAPEFSLPRLESADQTIGTSDLRGKVALLNVWATWCAACRDEHPVLMRIARGGEVPIYGLDYKDKRQDALVWLARLGDPYSASAFDEAGRVGIDWGVYGTPETFLLDRNGIVRYKHIGPLTWNVWERTLLPMIRELKSERG